MVYTIFLLFACNLHAATDIEEAKVRIENAGTFKVGDIIELNSGKHFVACAEKEQVDKFLDFMQKQDFKKMFLLLASGDCLSIGIPHSKYKIQKIDADNIGLIEIISVDVQNSEGVWTSSFLILKKCWFDFL